MGGKNENPLTATNAWRAGAFRFLVAPPDLTKDSDADRGCTWASEPTIGSALRRRRASA
jgi:hypothetical protein